MIDNEPNVFSHIYWMGGSPCAGKSSMAELIARRHNLPLYSVDAKFDEHRKRFSPEEQPTLIKWTSTPWDALWMQPQPVLLAEVIACYSEHFKLVVADLMGMQVEGRLLVEGNVLMPGHLARLNVTAARSIWVTPTASFQRRHYRQRGPWVQSILDQCRQPEQAFRNWMDRDIAFANWISAETKRFDLRHLEVDGSHTIAENAERTATFWNL